MDNASIFTQFFLETDRLNTSYRALLEKFEAVQQSVISSETRFSAKLAELSWLSHYLKTILDHISQGILLVDMQGMVTTCNPAAEFLLGKSASTLLFTPFSLHFEDALFGFSLKKVLQEKIPPSPRVLSYKNGEGKYVELLVEALFLPAPIWMDAKEPGSEQKQGLLLLMRNVTKERQLQQAAERSDRLKELGELSAFLAHEIRNPLAGIQGLAALLQDEVRDQPKSQKKIHSILEAVEQLNQLVSTILNYTRPFQAHVKNVSLPEFLLAFVAYLAKHPAWTPSIQLKIDAPENQNKVAMDPLLMRSALLNLSINAMEAMPNGGTLTFSSKEEEGGTFTEIQVQDTGGGISLENQKRLFSPFFTTKQTGTGLGLAEVLKVMQAHGGKVHVDSTEGEGTCFSLLLPKKESV